VLALEVGDELVKQTVGPIEFEPETAAQRHVLIDCCVQVCHAAPTGQGWATIVRARRSTLA
jgi:hypothetical protein